MAKYWIAAALLVLLPGSAQAQAQAPASCDTLTALVKQAPDGFASYVAGPATPYSLDASLGRRPANVSWGDSLCTVSSDDAIFRCTWDNASFADSVKFAAGCLPGAKESIAPGETYFTLPSKIIVSVTGADNSNEVLLTVRPL